MGWAGESGGLVLHSSVNIQYIQCVYEVKIERQSQKKHM